MSKSVDGMARIAIRLAELAAELERLGGWTQADLDDPELGRHMDVLKQHVENACGRSRVVVRRLSWIAARVGL